MKNEKLNLNKIIIIFLGLLVINSCSNEKIFTAEMKFDDGKWAYSEPLKGTFEIKDTLQSYDIELNINHKDDYPFQNIYLRITDDFTGTTVTDTVNINLADEYGVWSGKGISKNRELNSILRKSFKFKSQEKYNFSIDQFSRPDSLNGIRSIEFTVLKIKN
jgi:gliding motility-associated lipoprotein GldH